MAVLTLYNITMGSGNPSYLTNTLPGGAGVAVAGTIPNPWINAPRAEVMARDILDATQIIGGLLGATAAPAPIGSVLAVAPSTINVGGGIWAIPNQNLAAFAGQAFSEGQVGVVSKAGSTLAFDANPPGSGVGAQVVIQGPTAGLCVTPTAGGAIVPGTLLGSDGAGNLTPFQGPSAAATPVVTNVGTAGAVTVTYALVSVGTNGTYSAIGTPTATTTSNAVGTTANYNLISFTPPADSIGTVILRTTATGYTPATTGVIGSVGAGVTSFADTGLAIQANTSATQAFARPNAGATPTVVQVPGAVAGTSTWSYKITAISASGVWSVEGAAGSVATGNATLTPANANKITWVPSPGIPLYAIDRTAVGTSPTTIGFLGYATAAQATSGFIDYGIAATTFTPVIAPIPTPVSGATIAVSLGSLPAGTTVPTLVPVYVAAR